MSEIVENWSLENWLLQSWLLKNWSLKNCSLQSWSFQSWLITWETWSLERADHFRAYQLQHCRADHFRAVHLRADYVRTDHFRADYFIFFHSHLFDRADRNRKSSIKICARLCGTTHDERMFLRRWYVTAKFFQNLRRFIWISGTFRYVSFFPGLGLLDFKNLGLQYTPAHTSPSTAHPPKYSHIAEAPKGGSIEQRSIEGVLERSSPPKAQRKGKKTTPKKWIEPQHLTFASFASTCSIPALRSSFFAACSFGQMRQRWWISLVGLPCFESPRGSDGSVASTLCVSAT